MSPEPRQSVSLLEQVDRRIAQIISGSDQLVLRYVGGFSKRPGKRIRPRLLVAFAQLFGCGAERSITNCAACCELLHTASLIHDDVIDEADQRRGNPTLNHRFGNEIAVVVGDYLLALVFKALSEERDLALNEMMLDASQEIGLGVIQEIVRRNDFALTEEQYYETTRLKTATLFSLCCSMGAYLGGAEPPAPRQAGDYGMQLGLGFQVIDDLLDLIADPSVTGKPSLNDLREGRVTLPLIHALQEDHQRTKELVQAYQASPAPGAAQELVKHLQLLGSIEFAREAALEFLDAARRASEQFQGLAPAPAAAEELAEIERLVANLIPLPALKATG